MSRKPQKSDRIIHMRCRFSGQQDELCAVFRAFCGTIAQWKDHNAPFIYSRFYDQIANYQGSAEGGASGFALTALICLREGLNFQPKIRRVRHPRKNFSGDLPFLFRCER